MVGGNRKNELKALFAAGPIKPAAQPAAAPEIKSAAPAPSTQSVLTAVNSAPTATAAPAADVPRAASSAVRAMGLTLGAISREAEEARHLRQALTEGERVISLDPALIEGSFVSDRLSEEERDDAD